DPVAFLQKCLNRYDTQDIQGYRAMLHKQERIEGILEPPEDIELWFRAQPHSLLLRWVGGARQAASALYVEGENGGKVVVHPTGLVGRQVKQIAIEPNSPEAHHSGRYSITNLGMREMLARTVRQWKAAKAQADLNVEYLGVKTVLQTGDRACYTLRRTF